MSTGCKYNKAFAGIYPGQDEKAIRHLIAAARWRDTSIVVAADNWIRQVSEDYRMCGWTHLDGWVALLEPALRQVLNTLLPFGAELPVGVGRCPLPQYRSLSGLRPQRPATVKRPHVGFACRARIDEVALLWRDQVRAAQQRQRQRQRSKRCFHKLCSIRTSGSGRGGCSAKVFSLGIAPAVMQTNIRSMSMFPDQAPSAVKPKISPEERRRRTADRLKAIWLKMAIGRELDD